MTNETSVQNDDLYELKQNIKNGTVLLYTFIKDLFTINMKFILITLFLERSVRYFDYYHVKGQ